MTIEEIYSLIEKEGILIEWWNFNPPLEAIYWAHPNLPPIIGLSHQLSGKPIAYLKCVLAEELGHHYTTVGYKLPKTFFHYQDRIEISRTEYKALKWAANFLIPKKELVCALKKGIKTIWDLADYFEVTEEMINFRLKLLNFRR